jgi:hypothetical protein
MYRVFTEPLYVALVARVEEHRTSFAPELVRNDIAMLECVVRVGVEVEVIDLLERKNVVFF